MHVNELYVKQTGILFFDILNGYYHLANEKLKARMQPMVENAVRLMKAGREASIPIFFAKGNNRADSKTTGMPITDTNNALEPWPGGIVTKAHPGVVADHPGSEIIPELDPRPNDFYIPKYRWSAFYQTYLDLALRSLKLDTVIISGGSTDVGVAATVFAGKDMDYNLIVVRDACATGRDQRAHEVLMDLVFPRMSRVRTTDQVLQMIREAKDR
ncbi:MAG: cysteine hydrolase [Deltaproteobacteria bacterium]|nr:cysteine hydrolase [Deltaproteobacteria bacterium]